MIQIQSSTSSLSGPRRFSLTLDNDCVSEVICSSKSPGRDFISSVTIHAMRTAMTPSLRRESSNLVNRTYCWSSTITPLSLVLNALRYAHWALWALHKMKLKHNRQTITFPLERNGDVRKKEAEIDIMIEFHWMPRHYTIFPISLNRSRSARWNKALKLVKKSCYAKTRTNSNLIPTDTLISRENRIRRVIVEWRMPNDNEIKFNWFWTELISALFSCFLVCGFSRWMSEVWCKFPSIKIRLKKLQVIINRKKSPIIVYHFHKTSCENPILHFEVKNENPHYFMNILNS